MSRATFTKRITTPELIENINPDNKKLVKMFLKDKNRSCSDTTILKYEGDLNIFFVWNELYNDNKFFPNIKRREVSDFFSYCVDELKWQGKRFARVKSVLSSFSTVFCKYYYEDFPTYHNFINEVIESIPKDPVRKKTVLTDEQVEEMLRWLYEDKKLYAEACLLALAVYSGCRISELEQMTVDIIDENNVAFDGMFLATTREIRCKGKGKMGHMLTKFILKEPFLPYYRAWMKEREEIVKATGSTSNMLFLQKNGQPAMKETFISWKNKWEKRVSSVYGEEIPIYFHCFRHKLVTDLVKLNCSKDFIVYIIGWKSADMCDVYTDIDNRDRNWEEIGILKEALNKRGFKGDWDDEEDVD